jgi:transposase
MGEVKKRNPEPFIPLGFGPGQSMQGDFGEVMVKIGGEECKVYFWAQRLGYSRATCVSVYPRATQECFLDGQQRALQFFDGVPVMHIIDNLKAAIKSGLGRNAVEAERYDAFQTYYGFPPATELRVTKKARQKALWGSSRETGSPDCLSSIPGKS